MIGSGDDAAGHSAMRAENFATSAFANAATCSARNIRRVWRGHAWEACGSSARTLSGMLGLAAIKAIESSPNMPPHDSAAPIAWRSRSPAVPPDLKSVVRALCHDYSTEVTPSSAMRIGDFRDWLSPGTDVYITFLPGADYRDTVTLAARLRKEGYNPVPHIAARSIVDRASLDDYLARAVGEANVRHVLAIAGAPNKSCGEFADSMQLLHTGLFEKHGIRRVGVAGHPESCMCCSESALWDALKWKQAYAVRSGIDLHIVTQFAFEAGPFVAYDRALRREALALPLHVGVPGVASLKTLLGYAVNCGVGNSINFLKRQAQNVTKLLLPSAPEKLLLELALHTLSEPQTRIAKLHFFTLGGLQKTAQWVNAIRDGRFEIKADLAGISVQNRSR
jgi:methylenetetrahydrofolate reductase (NADPH)